MRVLVTGRRDYKSRNQVWLILDDLGADAVDEIIHGNCSGADTYTDEWAKHCGIKVTPYIADWGKYGPSAGPIRNQQMIDTKPDLVLAFDARKRNGRDSGTMDCVKRAVEAGIPVRIYP